MTIHGRRPVPPDILAREQADPEVIRKRQRETGPRAQVMAYRDPFDAPIPGAEEFVLLSGGVASPGVGTVQPAGLQLELKAGQAARIASITIYIIGLAATTDVRYQLRLNAAPIYPSLSFFPRAAVSAGDEYDAYVRVRRPGTISMDIQNVDGGAYTVGAIVTGWFFSKADAAKYVTEG
jgi:hypothetical protein